MVVALWVVFTATAARPSADSTISHVLLISIDGMHSLDYDNCVAAGTCPNLALLGQTGVNYKHTSASKPSDSFPGLTALVTGGTPKSTGIYYDVAYDRTLSPPAEDTGNGLSGGSCKAGEVVGTRTEYEEGVDIDQTQLGGGFAGYTNPLDGDYRAIKPTRLPRDPQANCAPVYPWNFIRTNTIYGVIHAAHLRTAWSDKHAVYAAVSGPTGTTTPDNLDDYYSPDVNSNLIPLPIHTATGDDCMVLDPIGGDYTSSFRSIRCYDQLKVNAVLHWIDGKTHLGDHNAPVPNIFGMNFQAVSVGQKLIENGVKGGYTDAAGTPTANMLAEIEFVDAAIGQMITELKSHPGLYESTAIIITAKHGQSPIDTHLFFPIPGHAPLNNGTPPSSLLGPTFLPDSEINQIGPTEDDISLLWLTDSGQTDTAVNILKGNAEAAEIDTIFAGKSLERMFDKPGLPADGGDPRTPDIIAQPEVGVVYTGSAKKQAEHGGFAPNDVEVMVLVSNPNIQAKTLGTPVETRQVAPTILSLLGLDPNALDAVRLEGTTVLPGIMFKQ
jgi:hypothetical protein